MSRFTFTRAGLDKLACPPRPDGRHHRVYVHDLKQPGLCLSVTSTGSKTFYVLKKVHGRVERIRLEAFPAIGIDQARDLARETIGKIAGGQNPAEDRRIARGEDTVGEMFARYIEDAKLRKRSWRADQAQYSNHLAQLSNRRLSSITSQDIYRLHSHLGKDRRYVANRVLALLSSVYNFARGKKVGYKGANPCQGIERFREPPRERFITHEEMPRFLAALDGYRDQGIADFFRLLLLTGARRSNVQSMAWADVSFGRRVWTIPGEQSKNGSPLQVYLIDRALELLQSRWRLRTLEAVHVFPTHSKSGHLEDPNHAWAGILKAAQITNLRIHDLRHTTASYMAMSGASLPMIGKALGHTSHRSTARYAHLAMGPVAAALQAAKDAMAAIPAPAPADVESGRATG